MTPHPDAPPRPLVVRRPDAPLAGNARVPGDKSISHRALMFAALAEGDTRIEGLWESEDVLRTVAAMRAPGAEAARDAEAGWRVRRRGLGRLSEPEDVLDMDNSGTGARLPAGLLASHPIVSVTTGDASLRRRPMQQVMGLAARHPVTVDDMGFVGTSLPGFAALMNRLGAGPADPAS